MSSNLRHRSRATNEIIPVVKRFLRPQKVAPGQPDPYKAIKLKKGVLPRYLVTSKSRDLVMHLCTSFGKYQMMFSPTLTRLKSFARMVRKPPSVEWTEVRIARFASSNRNMQLCRARVKAFHATKILVDSLDIMAVDTPWTVQPQDFPRVNALRAEYRRVPIQDEITALRRLIRNIEETQKINLARITSATASPTKDGGTPLRIWMGPDLRPAQLNRDLTYAGTLALESAVLELDIAVGNAGRLLINTTSHIVKKSRSVQHKQWNYLPVKERPDLTELMQSTGEKLIGNSMKLGMQLDIAATTYLHTMYQQTQTVRKIDPFQLTNTQESRRGHLQPQ